ncbi:MAG: sulfite exporter TauE/SafE family protein [Proteobacteria bacterium]|nr:sulfite exporter TauE/SafE family protein [Pseudomonadota bacterium]
MNAATAALFVIAVGLVAGAISGVIGTGSSVMLLPVLVYAFGPKAAIPIMSIAAIFGNLARVMAWWRAVDWRAVAAYALPGAPAASLGARTMLTLPSHAIDIGLGVFFLCVIPLRRWHAASGLRLRWWQVSIAGAAIGFLTGIVLSTGPLSVPVFLSYGLAGGAFLATEAASSVALYASKAATFRQLGALPLTIVLQGLMVGASLMVGTYGGKAVVVRIRPAVFQRLMDGLMVCSGLSLLWAGLR